jgi:hypothetical protein
VSPISIAVLVIVLAIVAGGLYLATRRSTVGIPGKPGGADRVVFTAKPTELVEDQSLGDYIAGRLKMGFTS